MPTNYRLLFNVVCSFSLAVALGLVDRLGSIRSQQDDVDLHWLLLLSPLFSLTLSVFLAQIPMALADTRLQLALSP